MARQKLAALHIKPAKNGGFNVSHHYQPSTGYLKGKSGGGFAMQIPPAEDHVFESQPAMMSHVNKATLAMVPMTQERAAEAEVAGKLPSRGMRQQRQQEQEVTGQE